MNSECWNYLPLLLKKIGLPRLSSEWTVSLFVTLLMDFIHQLGWQIVWDVFLGMMLTSYEGCYQLSHVSRRHAYVSKQLHDRIRSRDEDVCVVNSNWDTVAQVFLYGGSQANEGVLLLFWLETGYSGESWSHCLGYWIVGGADMRQPDWYDMLKDNWLQHPATVF